MPLFFSYHLPLNSWQWIVASSWVLPQHQCIPGTCQTEPILIVCKLPFDLEFLLSFIEECFQQDSAFSAYKLRATKRFWGPFCAIGPPFPLSSCRQSPCPYCLLLLPAQAGWLMQLPHLSLPAPFTGFGVSSQQGLSWCFSQEGFLLLLFLSGFSNYFMILVTFQTHWSICLLPYCLTLQPEC